MNLTAASGQKLTSLGYLRRFFEP
ncbi:hypothetical protein XAC1083_760052 [Xanthomonas citri pv. citri]|nr:hypothetical protein XAC1083_760052 [Xanthomonas citri pv. citri]CEE86590.1 hypothetical protein XACLC80_960003 [Xanthomonas citri pv. citri]